MAIDDEITIFQSFSERTLKYGRNLMVAAAPITVFYFEIVDLAGSRPLNFTIEDGGEIWIWVILLGLLVYYGFRFFGLAIPDFLHWKMVNDEYRAEKKSLLYNSIKHEAQQRAALATAHKAGDADAAAAFKMNIQAAQEIVRAERSILSAYNWRRTYFWIADAGLPTAFFGFALWASLGKIYALLCDLQLCQIVPRFVTLICTPEMPQLFP